MSAGPLSWRCTNCDTTWATDDLDQVQPDGHYACPMCTDTDPALHAIPPRPTAAVLLATIRGEPINTTWGALLDRCSHAIDADLGYFSGDVVISRQSFYEPVMAILAAVAAHPERDRILAETVEPAASALADGDDR